ncbi:MAG TPA: alpha/beta hydrolase [Pseudonocardia sp.]|jgi:pimeloyl-ACP methyl ester carboxylesterase|nr:alpha/beta hydrolase [Pseudonocardia sp.]
MPLSAAVDGFRLAYDDHPGGSPAVLLHGWPGDRRDHRAVVPLLAGSCRVVLPDLRGFGGSEHPEGAGPADFGAEAQARSVLGLVEELDLGPVVLAGYDVGSRVAQAAARARPDLVRALVLAPPLPGAGSRVLSPQAQPEFWYQAFHRLPLATELLDGSRAAVRAYLAHFWGHWSGPGYTIETAELDRLAADYARPGAFVASINWYRGGSGMVARSLAERPPDAADRTTVPTTVLWPEHDPLFPRGWSDRLGEWFTDVDLRLLDGVGHFVPLEAPEEVARAVRERAG